MLLKENGNHCDPEPAKLWGCHRTLGQMIFRNLVLCRTSDKPCPLSPLRTRFQKKMQSIPRLLIISIIIAIPRSPDRRTPGFPWLLGEWRAIGPKLLSETTTSPNGFNFHVDETGSSVLRMTSSGVND